jgi:hypothetical protein
MKALKSSSKTTCPLIVPDKRILLRACRLSNLAYEPPGKVHKAPIEGQSDYARYYTGEEAFIRRICHAYAFRMENDTEMWITFRGTSDVRSLIGNLDYRRQTVSLPNHPELTDIRLHKGFTEQFASVQPWIEHDLIATLRARPTIDNVYFVGHSSGAATARIAALYFGSLLKGRTRPVKVSSISFGSPRVGGGYDFEKAQNMVLDNGLLLVNGEDFVPSLPPRRCGYKHIGTTLKLDGNCAVEVKDDESWEHLAKLTPKGLEDHSLSSYQKNIENCLV